MRLRWSSGRLQSVLDRSATADIRSFIFREFGLRVKRMALYEEALTHSSMLDGDTTGLQSNERLEFLGDAALGLAVAAHLFTKFPVDSEGVLTQRRSAIVSRKTLNALGEKMGIAELIRAKMRRQDIRSSVVGNALEAVIGAVYLDHGYAKTKKAMVRLLRHHGAEDKAHEIVDYKSKMHQWAQRGQRTLEFEVVREFSEQGKARYEVEVRVEEEVLGSGLGSSKKSAEQRAARSAWRKVFQE